MQYQPLKYCRLDSLATLVLTLTLLLSTPAFADVIQGAGTTIIPTDVIPLPQAQERQSMGETFQLRALQVLPSKFYFTANTETSFRYETNPFQFPMKRQLIRQLPQGIAFLSLPEIRRAQIFQAISESDRGQGVFRCLPNITTGWALTDKTRVFANYFMIRDSLFHSTTLNTTIQSVGGGLQQDIPINKKSSLQATLQWREFFQSGRIPVFDYLPSLTYSRFLNSRTVGFASVLFQMRGKAPFQAPTREMDPFYTFGFLHQRGGWTLSSSATFNQNFRQPFAGNALIPINNYAWILDFEIARRMFKQMPGLQTFVRAEPIYNFHSNQTPGLAGVDFRIFYGIRCVVGKPPLTGALKQIREQLEEQEAQPPMPVAPSSSSIKFDYEPIAHEAQPMHGYMSEEGETTATAQQTIPDHVAYEITSHKM